MGIKGIRVLQIKTPVMFQAGLRCVLLVLPACLAGCTGGTALEQTPMVGLQITEYTDKMAFYRITDELRVRNITATILVNDTFAADNPYLIRQLDDEGCEIMVFARPTKADGSSTTMSKLTYEEQYAFVSQLKSGVEAVLGKPVTGFQCTQFDENADTYKVVNELGFQYNLGFVAESSQNIPGHEDAILPYQVDDYGFWAVPMHCAEWEGERQAFCDNSFADLTAEEWESLLKSELDRMDTADQPLLVEFHSYQTGWTKDAFRPSFTFLIMPSPREYGLSPRPNTSSNPRTPPSAKEAAANGRPVPATESGHEPGLLAFLDTGRRQAGYGNKERIFHVFIIEKEHVNATW